MTANYGINVITSVKGSQPLTVDSSTVIAIVGVEVDAINTEMQFYGSASEALKDKDGNDVIKKGTVKQALTAINNQNANCPIITRSVSIDEDVWIADTEDLFHGDTDLQGSLKKAIQEIKSAYAKFGYSPDVIICPDYSQNKDIIGELKIVADFTRAVAVADISGNNEEAIVGQVGDYPSERLILANPRVNVFDLDANATISVGASSYIAGMIAKTDGAWNHGYADSFSNKVVSGISGSERTIDVAFGQNSEADRLREGQVTTLIRQQGFRFWGGETTSSEPIWQDLTRVRVFDKIAEVFLKQLYWAIDKRATILLTVKNSVEELLLSLKGNNVLLDYEVSWNAVKNTTAEITAGRFYLDVATANIPIVKQINIDLQLTDQFNETLLNNIQ